MEIVNSAHKITRGECTEAYTERVHTGWQGGERAGMWEIARGSHGDICMDSHGEIHMCSNEEIHTTLGNLKPVPQTSPFTEKKSDPGRLKTHPHCQLGSRTTHQHPCDRI